MSEWKGYYVYGGGHFPMVFSHFNIEANPNGKIAGQGTDEVGAFTINGNFNNAECRFVKTYETHNIYYKGTFDYSSNAINGHWAWEEGEEVEPFKIYR